MSKKQADSIEAALKALSAPSEPQVYEVPGQTVVNMPPDALGDAQAPGFKATELVPKLPTDEETLADSPPLVPIAAKRATVRKSADPAQAKASVAAAEAPGEDALLKGYKDKASGLQGDRIAALEKAAGEKELSDSEKVAMALLATLPGLVGAIGGGAIAGGWGAASGLAGGLQGGAAGTKSIIDTKEGRRKEAKGDADKILEQIMAMEGQATRRQETLEGRAIDDKKTKESASLQERLTQLRESGDNRRAKLSSETQIKAAEIGARSRDYNAELDAKTAQARANAKDPAIKQSEKDFYANLDSALRSISALEDLVNGDAGNWESRFGDPDAASGLEQLQYKLAVANAKIVDPTSVAREGEVEASKKFMVPMGFAIPNSVTAAALKRMRSGLVEQASARSQLGAPLPESAYQAAREQSGVMGAAPQQDWRSMPGTKARD